MSITSRTLHIISLSLLLLSVNSWGACGDCISIRGNFVTVNEVGIVDADYFYAITNLGKVQLSNSGYELAKLAFIYSKEMYINTDSKNFTIATK